MSTNMKESSQAITKSTPTNKNSRIDKDEIKLNLELIGDNKKENMKENLMQNQSSVNINNYNMRIFNNNKNESLNLHVQLNNLDNSLDKKNPNISFDERIIRAKQKYMYVFCNRLVFSKQCVYYYIMLLVFSIFVLCYSLVGYFTKISNT